MPMYLDKNDLQRYSDIIDTMRTLPLDTAARIFATAKSAALMEQWAEYRKSPVRSIPERPMLKLSNAVPCPCQLVGWTGIRKRESHMLCTKPPGWDHAQMWNVNGQHALITYAPYSMDIGAIVDFCRDEDLIATIIPAGWYFPNLAIQLAIGTHRGFELAGRTPTFSTARTDRTA